MTLGDVSSESEFIRCCEHTNWTRIIFAVIPLVLLPEVIDDTLPSVEDFVTGGEGTFQPVHAFLGEGHEVFVILMSLDLMSSQ